MKTYTHASAELDAEIAEKVFGWEWWTFIRHSYLLHPLDVRAHCFSGSSWERGRFKPVERSEQILRDQCRRMPAYSSGTTLTDACGLVVEAMGKRGFDCTIKLWNNIAYTCEFTKPSYEFSRTSPDAPLCICLAALAALNAETKKE